jgi:hypothetical protein
LTSARKVVKQISANQLLSSSHVVFETASRKRAHSNGEAKGRNMVSRCCGSARAWDRPADFRDWRLRGRQDPRQYACTSNNIQVFPGRGACAALFGPFGVLQASGQTLSGGWFAGVGFEHDLPLKGTLKTMC